MGTRCVVGAHHEVVRAPSHPKPRVRVVTKFPPLDHPHTTLFGFRVFLPPVPPIKGALQCCRSCLETEQLNRKMLKIQAPDGCRSFLGTESLKRKMLHIPAPDGCISFLRTKSLKRQTLKTAPQCCRSFLGTESLKRKMLNIPEPHGSLSCPGTKTLKRKMLKT